MAPARSRAGLTVHVVDHRGRSAALARRRGAAAKAAGLAVWLRRAAPRRARGEVTVALVNDARVRALNRRYRGRDYPTDVLSFPAERQDVAQPFRAAIANAGLKPWATETRRPADATQYLGDVVIATGVARRQARDLGHSFAVELRILSLHGLLHLLGYDHERDRGRMRTLEQRLLRQSGVRNGLIERARA